MLCKIASLGTYSPVVVRIIPQARSRAGLKEGLARLQKWHKDVVLTVLQSKISGALNNLV